MKDVIAVRVKRGVCGMGQLYEGFSRTRDVGLSNGFRLPPTIIRCWCGDVHLHGCATCNQTDTLSLFIGILKVSVWSDRSAEGEIVTVSGERHCQRLTTLTAKGGLYHSEVLPASLTPTRMEHKARSQS